jgi:oligoendopeptidase F
MIRTRAFVTALALVCLSPIAAAQQHDRASIADKYKWNLADLYASDDAWRAAKDKLDPEIAKLAAFKGTLATSPARLADALDSANRVAKELQKVYLFASLISDQDTRVSKYQGMQQEMQQIGAKFGETTAYIEPEIL